MEQTQANVRNDSIKAVMACLFMVVMLAILFCAFRAIRQAQHDESVKVRETVAVWRWKK